MVVEVRLEGHLRYLRPECPERLEVEIPRGATVRRLIDLVGVPWADVGATAVNGQTVPESTVLADGDSVMLLAPLAGG